MPELNPETSRNYVKNEQGGQGVPGMGNSMLKGKRAGNSMWSALQISRARLRRVGH